MGDDWITEHHLRAMADGVHAAAFSADHLNRDTEHWLRSLAEHEHSICRAAAQLEGHLPAGPARSAVAEVSQYAAKAVKALLGAMPLSAVRHRPSGGWLVPSMVRAAVGMGDAAALGLLEAALRRQDGRLCEALDVVNPVARYAIVRRVRPAHMRASRYLRDARERLRDSPGQDARTGATATAPRAAPLGRSISAGSVLSAD